MEMNKKRQFSDAFKTEAIRRVVQDGRTKAQVAREMGFDRFLFTRWMKRAKELGVTTPNPLNESEREQLERTTRELERLKLENEILKKAAAFFARSLP
jgi:transposase